MKIAISAESQIDLSQADIKKYKIQIVHMYITKGDKTYLDNEFSLAELFEYTEKTDEFCHTSATNVGDYEDHFNSLLKEYDEVIHLAISSGLSCGYQNALIARNDNPRIHVIDTLASSGGSALYAVLASKLVSEGKSVDEIISEVTSRIGKRECTFQINTLDYIYRGGRCSKVTRFGTNLLKIKPVIVCEEDGKLHLGKLHRGKMSKCVNEYFEETLSKPNIDYSFCVMEYSTLDEEGKKLYEESINKVKEAGFKEILLGECSPIAAYHAGPNIIGIQFFYTK
ncbi:MAG: DegV family protein [Bacilli bacterium]|nr:DegV family protein [Bacilli bacterium]